MTKKLSFLLSVLILSFAFGYLIFAWTEPGSAPPSGNVPTPINVGSETQTKIGAIRADGGFQVDGYEMVGSNADKLYANRRNTIGGGIWISDDGGFYDYNNGYIDFRGSTGIRILESDGSWGNNSIRAANLCIQNDCRSSWPAGGDITAVNAGTGLTGGGSSGDVTLSADTSYLQRRVSGTCSSGSSIRVINSNGSVSCETDDIGITSESDTLQTVTNRGRVTTQTIRSPRFEDYNNTAFYADPASTSYFNDMRASIYYDRDNTGYYVNPASNSWLYRIYTYDIRADIMYDRNNTGYYVNPASTSNLNNVTVGGTLRIQYTRVDRTCYNRYCKATCSSGWRVVGGGCESSGGVVQDNRPEYRIRSDWDRSWVCYGGSGVIIETTYAICLKIQQP